jgi:hypothetical protein
MILLRLVVKTCAVLMMSMVSIYLILIPLKVQWTMLAGILALGIVKGG